MISIIPGMKEFKNFFDGFDHISFFENELINYWNLQTRIVDDKIRRKSWSINLEDNLHDKNIKEYYDNFLTKLNSALDEYSAKFIIPEILPEKINNNFSVTLLKYMDTDEIDYHYDTSMSDNRIAAALGYFNDDYFGGNLEFKHFNVELKPDKNSLIIFPSNYPYLHRSAPITSGIKYAIRCFLVSKNID